VQLAPGATLTRAFKLAPRPIAVTLDIRPKTAAWTLTTADGRTRTGTGSWKGSVPAGATKLRVTAAGSQPRERSVFIDAPTSFSEWLDPSGQLVHKLGIYRSVPAPKGVSLTPDGKQVWVTALVTQPSIEVYDVATGKPIAGVDLGKNGAVEVTFNRDGTRAYASQMQSASVYEIDTKTYKVLRKMSTGSSWTKIVAVAPDGKRIYAANWSGDDVSEIDLATGKLLRRIKTVDTPRGVYLTPDGKRMFVAGFGEQTNKGAIQVFDLATGKGHIIQKGRAMRHMVADEKAGKLYTSDLGADRVYVTDLATEKTKLFAMTDHKPNTIDLSPDGKVLFVSCRGANNPVSYYQPGPEWGSILLFDTTTGKPLDAIIGGNQCTALDVSDDGRILVFSDFMDNRIRIYEVPPYETLARGNGGRYEAHLTEVRKDGKRLVVTGSGGGGD
jgi:YVTN family beta-propeller protein